MLQQHLVVESVCARALLHGTLAQSGADAAKQSQPCRLTEPVVGFGCNITTKKRGGAHAWVSSIIHLQRNTSNTRTNTGHQLRMWAAERSSKYLILTIEQVCKEGMISYSASHNEENCPFMVCGTSMQRI